MPVETSRRPTMARPVASTAPATLLNVRSLIVLKSALLSAGPEASVSAGIPAPYCARLSYTLPPPAQPASWSLMDAHEPDRPDPRADGGHPTARQALGGYRRRADDRPCAASGAGRRRWSRGHRRRRRRDRRGRARGGRGGGADRPGPALGLGPNHRRPERAGPTGPP